MIRFILFFTLIFTKPVLANDHTQHWITDKKTQVYFHPTPGLPMFDVALVIKGGSRSTTPGLAHLMATTTSMGSKFLNQEQIGTKLDQYGSELNASTSRDSMIFHLRTLAGTPVDQVVSIFKESLFYSAFPSHEVRDQIEKTYNQLAFDQLQPEKIAEQHMMRALFPSAPFFYSPIGGYADTLIHLSPSDLARFHNKILNPENTTIIILGDIDGDKANTIANQLSDGMISSLPLDHQETLTSNNDAQTISIKPDHEQVYFYYATKLPVRLESEQYASWLLINELLGANSSSLLFQALRDNKPLVYSIHSSIIPIDNFIVLTISGESNQKNVAEINQTIDRSLNRLKKQFVNEKQLSIAQKGLINKLKLLNTNNTEQLNQLISLSEKNLKPGYQEALIETIEALTVTKVHQALQKLDTNQIYKVYVGH